MQHGRELDAMERVMVIIDGGYLNGLRRSHGTMVDMSMLKRYIQNTFGDIVATHWLTSTSYNDRHLLEPFMKWISYYPWITLHEHTRKSKRCSVPLKSLTQTKDSSSQRTQPGGFAKQLPVQLPTKRAPFVFQCTWLKQSTN